MRQFVRPIVAVLSMACLVAMMAIASADKAQAQARQAPPKQTASAQAAPSQQPAIKQMPLIEKQIEGVLAAQHDMDMLSANLPANAKPDPKLAAQLDGVAKKNGFVSYDEYSNVVDNITIVLAGFDPATKKYVGNEAVIKAQIAELQADKKMRRKDKKAALADLNDALKSPAAPIENKGNIDLVAKYYEKLADALDDDDDDE
jgi:hypothetical protein